jgi:PAS domain S-box-containing protein
MSMNEELQSTNEELEATTEELRSLNEELTTVNAQLREKVEQLERAHDDLHNFFASAKVATLFLDEQLRVKRYTPAAQELLSIDHADIDRCITDIARELLQQGLAEDARNVLDHLTTQRRDLQTSDGHWVTRQVLPYRTESRRIEGVVVTFTDITELRAANESLEAKSRRLELAWDAARGGVYEHRVPLDETTYHSDQWAQVLGYRPEELPPPEGFEDWLREQIHPDDREVFAGVYKAFLAGEVQRLQIEARLRHHGGHWVWVRGVAKALERDAEGRVRHVLGMMIDITDLKRTEAALRETESRFREMADGLPLIVWVHDADGQQEYVNATFCEVFGVTREEMTGGRWQALLHPDDADAYNREFAACLREQRPFHGEARVQDARGRWRWVESWGRPRRGSGGDFGGFVGASADITERKEMEAAVRESEERFRTLADNIAQLAWMADSKGGIFWYNKRWYDYTGTTFEEVQGWGWQCVHHPDHVERVVTKIDACFEEGELWEDTFPLRAADGSYRWFLSRALPIRDHAGRVVRWFGTNTDITEQRIAEQQLREADRQKDEYLAMLGHELRNPLAAIRTATDLLGLSEAEDPMLTRARDVLERQTGHMARLLDGLLDVSRIAAGKIRLDTKVVDLVAVCRTVLDDAETTRNGRDLALLSDWPDEPVWVEADAVRITQVVDNLITNAIKFTPDGGEIRLRLATQGGMAVLVVEDTGKGIEPELLPHVFDSFRQSAQALDRAFGGLGLGLALVKGLVELHGGEVSAASDGPDRGATFVVRLPLASAPSRSVTPARTATDGPLRVLVIDDNRDAARALADLLTAVGYQVELAFDGRQGVQAATEQLPDLILCDIGLPDGMSGYAVARTLRDDPRTRELALVAATGYGDLEHKEKAREAGFDAHLTKPMHVDDIRRVVRELGLDAAAGESPSATG